MRVVFLEPLNGQDHEAFCTNFSVTICNICPTVDRLMQKLKKDGNIKIHRHLGLMKGARRYTKKFFSKTGDKPKLWAVIYLTHQN